LKFFDDILYILTKKRTAVFKQQVGVFKLINSEKNLKLLQAKFSFDTLAVYRQLLEDEVLRKLAQLVNLVNEEKCNLSQFIRTYNDFYFSLINAGTCSLKDYIADLIIYTATPFSKRLSTKNLPPMDSQLEKAVINDLTRLEQIANLSAFEFKEHALNGICSSPLERKIINELPEWNNSPDCLSYNSEDEGTKLKQSLLTSSNWSQHFSNLSSFFQNNGSGIFARYKAFIWEGENKLTGISSPDPIKLTDLIGYEKEREIVIENTLLFLKNLPANNVLLYGDRGTGKSSTVKALLNEYHSLGLRLIELPKPKLADFPKLVRVIKNINLKFIIFIDDLAFEDSEENYTSLKAVLEGSIENKPENLVIYATSNRRHLIKETFSDRAGLYATNSEDQVRAADNIQEKLSLSDRFGITVIFSSPDQDKYLEIVRGIAQKRGLDIDLETITKEALKWELWYNGRSPRTARQFVDWLEGKIKTKKGDD